MEILTGKKGYISVISSIFLVIFILVGVFFLNVYIYIESHSQIEKEFSTLVDITAKKGGLPESDITEFKDRLKMYPYMTNKIDKIEINAVTDKSEIDCLNTSDLDDVDGTYISTKDNENIILTVKTPANINNVLNYLTSNYLSNNLSDTYIFNRKIVSKRERPIKEEDLVTNSVETMNTANTTTNVAPETLNTTNTVSNTSTETVINTSPTIEQSPPTIEQLPPPIAVQVP